MSDHPALGVDELEVARSALGHVELFSRPDSITRSIS